MKRKIISLMIFALLLAITAVYGCGIQFEDYDVPSTATAELNSYFRVSSSKASDKKGKEYEVVAEATDSTGMSVEIVDYMFFVEDKNGYTVKYYVKDKIIAKTQIVVTDNSYAEIIVPENKAISYVTKGSEFEIPVADIDIKCSKKYSVEYSVTHNGLPVAVSDNIFEVDDGGKYVVTIRVITEDGKITEETLEVYCDDRTYEIFSDFEFPIDIDNFGTGNNNSSWEGNIGVLSLSDEISHNDSGHSMRVYSNGKVQPIVKFKTNLDYTFDKDSVLSFWMFIDMDDETWAEKKLDFQIVYGNSYESNASAQMVFPYASGERDCYTNRKWFPVLIKFNEDNASLINHGFHFQFTDPLTDIAEETFTSIYIDDVVLSAETSLLCESEQWIGGEIIQYDISLFANKATTTDGYVSNIEDIRVFNLTENCFEELNGTSFSVEAGADYEVQYYKNGIQLPVSITLHASEKPAVTEEFVAIDFEKEKDIVLFGTGNNDSQWAESKGVISYNLDRNYTMNGSLGSLKFDCAGKTNPVFKFVADGSLKGLLTEAVEVSIGVYIAADENWWNENGEYFSFSTGSVHESNDTSVCIVPAQGEYLNKTWFTVRFTFLNDNATLRNSGFQVRCDNRAIPCSIYIDDVTVTPIKVDLPPEEIEVAVDNEGAKLYDFANAWELSCFKTGTHSWDKGLIEYSSDMTATSGSGSLKMTAQVTNAYFTLWDDSVNLPANSVVSMWIKVVAGRSWWEENGSDFSMVFDPSKDYFANDASVSGLPGKGEFVNNMWFKISFTVGASGSVNGIGLEARNSQAPYGVDVTIYVDDIYYVEPT